MTSCEWSNAKALVENINADKLNVTNVVAQCINVCELAFETKKSEIFGPGITISMLVETILLPIFGVLFPVIVWLLNRRSTRKIAPATIFLRKVQTLVLQTTAFLIISLLVTAVSTSRQASEPSILELTYLSSNMDFQFWTILGVILTQSADNSMNQTQISGYMHLAYYILFIAQLVTSSTIKIPHQDVYKTLAKECHKQRQFISAMSTTSGAEAAKWAGIGFGGGIILIGGMVLGIMNSGRFPSFLTRPFKALWRTLPTWLKTHTDGISNFFIMVMYSSFIPENFYKLHKLRKLALQTMPAGGEEWGYGQTTAVLLWLPLVLCTIKETIKYMTAPEEAEDSQTEMSFSEKEEEESPRSPAPPPYDYPHPATVSTATTQVDSNDLETDSMRRTSSGLRASNEQSVTGGSETE